MVPPLLLLLVSYGTSPAVCLFRTDWSPAVDSDSHPGLSPVFPGSPSMRAGVAAPALWEDLSLSPVQPYPALRTFLSQTLDDDADGDPANPRLGELLALCL